MKNFKLKARFPVGGRLGVVPAVECAYTVGEVLKRINSGNCIYPRTHMKPQFHNCHRWGNPPEKSSLTIHNLLKSLKLIPKPSLKTSPEKREDEKSLSEVKVQPCPDIRLSMHKRPSCSFLSQFAFVR